MTQQLFPVFVVPPLPVSTDRAKPVYGTSWEFDFERGEFVLDGAGRFVAVDGEIAWAQWCVKAVLTERLTYAIYGPNFGAEIDRVHQSPNAETARAEAERAITEALLADPAGRTAAVSGFVFTQDRDELRVECDVTPAVGETRRISVSI